MIDDTLRELVRRRAGDRCEYCRLPQHAVDGTFHVEHIVAQQHRQDDSDANLCLACARCNLHKGTNLASIDPDTGDIVAIFNPRQDDWSVHFGFHGARVVGRTPSGRATVRLLQMNSRHRIQLRAALLARRAF